MTFLSSTPCLCHASAHAAPPTLRKPSSREPPPPAKYRQGMALNVKSRQTCDDGATVNSKVSLKRRAPEYTTAPSIDLLADTYFLFPVNMAIASNSN